MNENKGLKEFLCSKTGGVVLTLIVYAVTLIVMCVIGALSDSIGDSPVVGVVGLILLAVWTILGWKALSMIQPNIFLIMPIGGWVIYFVVKGFISMLLGIFIAPYQLAKIIRTNLQKSL